MNFRAMSLVLGDLKKMCIMISERARAHTPYRTDRGGVGGAGRQIDEERRTI